MTSSSVALLHRKVLQINMEVSSYGFTERQSIYTMLIMVVAFNLRLWVTLTSSPAKLHAATDEKRIDRRMENSQRNEDRQKDGALTEEERQRTEDRALTFFFYMLRVYHDYFIEYRT